MREAASISKFAGSLRSKGVANGFRGHPSEREARFKEQAKRDLNVDGQYCTRVEGGPCVPTSLPTRHGFVVTRLDRKARMI